MKLSILVLLEKCVVICEGNLYDPDFTNKLNQLVLKLTDLVDEKKDKLTVDKVSTIIPTFIFKLFFIVKI